MNDLGLMRPDRHQDAVIADWLAGIFIAPLPAGAVADYCGAEGRALLDEVGKATGCVAGVERMQSVFATDAPPESVASDLSTAYMLLFEGVGGPYTVPPYQSAYAGEGGRLFQQATGDMEEMLRRSNLSVSTDCCEPPDHLSIELALLATAIRRDDHSQVALMGERLLSWVPEFVAGCDSVDRGGFYGGAAMVLEEFLFLLRRRRGEAENAG